MHLKFIHTPAPVSKPKKKKKKHKTAPKPLEVNDDTRWKAKVFVKGKDGNESGEGVDSKNEILRKAMLVLNKMSLTTFDKLSGAFIDCGVGRDIDCLTGAVGMIVTKAQEEQHFASMYADLCLKLARTTMEGIDGGSNKGEKFKKILMERCQTEFERDAATKNAEATEGVTDEDFEFHSNFPRIDLIKKHYLGHVRFIGELYKNDLLSIEIILRCLPSLLAGDCRHPDKIDEDKVECFSTLMAVIGSSLDQQSEAMASAGKKNAADGLKSCWKAVEIMAGKRKDEGPKVSNRIKFMLQDLLEMKSKGAFECLNPWKSTRLCIYLNNCHQDGSQDEKKRRRRPSQRFAKKQPKKSAQPREIRWRRAGRIRQV